MTSDQLRIEAEDGVAIVTLARAERRNALNEELVNELGAFFADPPRDLRAAVIHGEGAHFCAGLDLAEQSTRTPVQSMRHSCLWHQMFEQIEHGRIPVIAALHGAVIGGGLELALATHIRVADETAFYSLPEGRLGIFVGGGASVRVGRLIGADRMREMMLTGRRVDAEEGQALGFSHYRAADGSALEQARELAARVAQNAPLTNELILTALARIDDMSRADGLYTEALVTAVTQSTDDAAEGLRAFLEKRPPEFRGR
jgi:(methylthio)acryloyl-CoA hydratase